MPEVLRGMKNVTEIYLIQGDAHILTETIEDILIPVPDRVGYEFTVNSQDSTRVYAVVKTKLIIDRVHHQIRQEIHVIPWDENSNYPVMR